MFTDIESVQAALKAQGYFADRALSTTVFLSGQLGKPLFLEGEAGVGKTELAKVVAKSLDTRLIRLQCYEGLDASHALYEWNYPRQLLRIKLGEASGGSLDQIDRELFSEEYLIRRPLLDAITADGSPSGEGPVLLIDEVDRADEEFEAFLLEVLSDFQITIPELGTLRAKRQPFVVITSNRTREIHDALKRRCLYLWIDYPEFDREYEILCAKVAGINERLAGQICTLMQQLRQQDFYKKPGIAETIDWGAALMALHRDELDAATVEETLGCIFKYNDDIEAFRRGNLVALLEQTDINKAM
jgi:MoxR-like ATPase